MALTETQQVLESLRKSERPVIAFPKQWNPDAVASAAGLYALLKDLGKRPEIVCDGFAPAEHLKFLPHLNQIRPELSGLRKFVISIDTAKSRVGELSYEAKDGFLHIYLTPKSGSFEPHHVKTGATGYQHDLIIVVDAPDLRSLGSISDQSADFFFHTPVVNLDHSPANENYGQVNYVDPTATSVGEILYHLIKEMNRPITPDLATALLTGIIAKTRSFRTGALTPRALAAASELVALGAKRDLIVASLYRTKTIPTLKLWGRTLARMKFDADRRIVSTVLTRQDFALAGADEETLPDVIEELIASAPEAETVALLYEREGGGVCCVIRNDIRKNADQLSARWGGEGGKIQARCFLKDVSIIEAEKEVLAHLRASLATA